MTFKPGDLVRPTVQRRRFNGAKLALVLRFEPVSSMVLVGHDPTKPGIYIKWFKTGEQTWEYVDLFEKVSK
jgi:hypothetical protein